MPGRSGRRRNQHRAWPLSVVLIAVLGIAIAACGSSKSKSSSSPSSASTPAPAASGPGVGKPAVTIGDKNFSEENILGALYAQALQAKGYKVSVKDNVGSTEIAYKALTAGQIDLYPEYTGVLLSAVAGQTRNPASATAAYDQAKAFVEAHGLALLRATPFFDTNAFATLPGYAKPHGLKSIADLKPLGRSVKLGGAPEFATRFEGLPGLRKEYGVNPTFVPIAIELSYKALEGGQTNVQNVFTTDGQLLSGKYTVLSDPKHLFGFQNVAPVVRRSVLAAEGPEFAETLDKVSALLTLKAIQQMNAAVSIDRQTPASVAHQFLAANGLA
jgi:osmoprotectant transport system substrate-binding protein